MHGDVVKSVYCHWDGNLSGVGATLQGYYDSSKANQLVALGNLSKLGKNIGQKHEFDTYHLTPAQREQHQLDHGNSCTFYGRDREEKHNEWQVAFNFTDFLDQVAECGAEYYYINKDNVWYVGSPESGSSLVELAEALQLGETVA
jgi:hypothetical protein